MTSVRVSFANLCHPCSYLVQRVLPMMLRLLSMQPHFALHCF